MRIGILGAGEMGQTHARAYLGQDGVEIAGIVGRDEGRVRQAAQRLDVPGSTDPARILDDPSVDAVDITYPSAYHRDYAVAALDRGKHVFCETPLALSLGDAASMIEAARAAGRLLLVAALMRFVGEYRFMHDAVLRGDLGAPRTGYAARLSKPIGSEHKPRDFATYGDPFTELAIFDIGCLNWVFGLPRTVSAAGVFRDVGFLDYATASLQYDGACAIVEAGANMPPSFPFSTRFRLGCDRGLLDCSGRFDGHYRLMVGPDPAGIPIPESTLTRYGKGDATDTLVVLGGDPYDDECAYFVRCVRGEADPAYLGAEIDRDALRVIEAARKSIREGTAGAPEAR